MYNLRYSGIFRKQLRLMDKRGKNLTKINHVIECLAENGTLPASYKPHKLKGDYSSCWEAHIEPDWLIVWQINDNELIILFIATGTHSDLF